MYNSPLYQRCLEIATEAHKGQFRNDGVTPYITHPIAVAEMLTTETEKCIALLHDVLEDTPFKYDDLIKLGVPRSIVDSVNSLSKCSDETYLEYILNIKLTQKFTSDITKVKLADMAHNSLTAGKTMRDKYELVKYILTH